MIAFGTNRTGYRTSRIGCRISLYAAGQEVVVRGQMEQAAGRAR